MAFLNKIFKKTKSFSDLNKTVKSGSEIILDSDYFFKISKDKSLVEGIELNTDDLVIDGKGHSIEGAEVAVAFVINADNVTLKNINFKDCVCVFIVNEHSSLKVSDCEFGENINSVAAGVIVNKGNVEISNCEFRENAGGAAGCIYNDGVLNISNSLFKANYSNNGGAIHNNANSKMNIYDCKFYDNSAKPRYGVHESVGFGGAIGNFGTLEIRKCEFHDNSAELDGGAIDHLDGFMSVEDSIFKNNKSHVNGGAICSISDSTVSNSVFEENSARISDDGNGGSCIYIRDCEVTCTDSIFKESYSNSIVNWGNIILKNPEFSDNKASPISNYGKMKLHDSTFIKNDGILSNFNELEIYSSYINGNHLNDSKRFIYNDTLLKIHSTEFSKNKIEKDCIFNAGEIIIMESKFHENDFHTLIYNSENSDLTLSNGNFKANHLNSTLIYNCGKEASIIDSIFEDNSSEKKYCDNIINKSHMNLSNPTINGYDHPNILNDGEITIKNSENPILEFISGKGETKFIAAYEESYENENAKCGFWELNQIIQENKDNHIVMKSDIKLNNYEWDFFEGGIELTKDNLHINGNGHVIDANNKSRIFHILGKNIVLENITFKNTYLGNNFDKHTNGGGALRILKDASVKLINCIFINSHSDDDGGAILNRGHLNLENSQFEECTSELYGGAIYNHGTIATKDVSFSKNNSKISTIYNDGTLTLQTTSFDSCHSSHIHTDIFNIGNLHFEGNLAGRLLNYGNINKENVREPLSFAQFKELIDTSNNKITLNQDIAYDYDKDKNSILPLPIEKNIIIDGTQHIIDGVNSAPFFKIKGNVIFKNLTFRNGFSHLENLIDIEGEVTFKNCNFINNKVRGKAKLISMNESVSFINCNFINNSSKNTPLISNHCNASMANSDLINNHAKDSSIVANHVGCNLTMQDSKIIDSFCDSVNHSILINQGNMKLLSSTCSFNQTNGSGGVIYNLRPYNENEETINSILNVDGCEFSNNSARITAGVLLNGDFAEAYVKNSRFIKNNAFMHSGASVIENRDKGYLEVVDSTFSDNETKTGNYYFLHYDGAIANSGKFNVERCEFR